jgi:hypothetical protein
MKKKETTVSVASEARREAEEQGTAAALAAADDALWAATYDPDHEYAALGYRWDPPYGWVL